MKNQLIKLLSQYGLSATRFADEIGVQRSSISHILSGRNKPSYDFIMRIVDKYPEIDVSWLLTGKGNMIVKKSNDTDKYDTSLLMANTDKDQRRKSDIFDNKKRSEKISDAYVDKSKQDSFVTKVKNIEYVILLYNDGTFIQYANNR